MDLSTIICATNVPISTSGYSSPNANLTCVTDCTSDGGYSTKPVSILTDCISASSSLGMMTSQRSVNITLTAGAHFYLAYVGSSWKALNNPSQSGLEWSILSFIDLRMRPDGFINTPPTANVVSPQYVVVNKTAKISISVSDANVGDDVRCRWSKYTPGYRRRKRSEDEDYIRYGYDAQIKNKLSEDGAIIYNGIKRSGSSGTTAIHTTTVGTKYTPGYLQEKLSKEEEYIRYGYSAEIYKKLSEGGVIIYNRIKRLFANCAGCTSTCILFC